MQVNDPSATKEGAVADRLQRGWEVQVDDASAAREGVLTDGLHRVRGDVQLHDPSATFEGAVANRLQRGGDMQVNDPSATKEGILADLDHRVRHPHLSEVCPVLVRPVVNLRHAVRHDKQPRRAIRGFHRGCLQAASRVNQCVLNPCPSAPFCRRCLLKKRSTVVMYKL